MKKIVILIMLVSLKAHSIHYSEFEGRFDCPDINNSLICAQYIEKANVIKYSYIQRISKNTLRLIFKDGSQRTYENKEYYYSALEVTANGRFLVLHQQHYEGHSFILVNLLNGSELPLTGYPVFSPNNQYFVVAEQDIDAGYSVNTLQVFQTGNMDAPVFDAKPINWGPGDVKWLDNDTISFVRVSFNNQHSKDFKAPRYNEEQQYLVKQGGGWAISLNKGKHRKF